MASASSPFPLPAALPEDLARIRDHWTSLKRGDAAMPFWDDVKLSALQEIGGQLMLLDSPLDHPQRFRFNMVGEEVRHAYAGDLVGKFIDEVPARPPIDFLAAQASATVEARSPTLFAGDSRDGGGRPLLYDRLLLPLWGNGRIEMLLGGIGNMRRG